MMMRCRYSRRLYILKSQFHNPDYIDDEDFSFLENLIIFHTDYVNKSAKVVYIDCSLLNESYRSLFKRISNKFPQITDSGLKTDLYKSFDLEYKGEERHTRNLREQIIDYLQHKKGHIFTNRRVEFFLKLSTTTARDELRRLCKEMLFSIKSPRRPNLGIRKKDGNKHKNSFSIVTESNPIGFLGNIDLNTTNIETLETLFLPYLAMIHPPCGFDYMKVDAMIKHNSQETFRKANNSFDNKENGVLSKGGLPTACNNVMNDKILGKQGRYSLPESTKSLVAVAIKKNTSQPKNHNVLPPINTTDGACNSERNAHLKTLERKMQHSRSVGAPVKRLRSYQNTGNDSLKALLLSTSKRHRQNIDSLAVNVNKKHSTIDTKNLHKDKKLHKVSFATSKEMDDKEQTKKETSVSLRDSRLRQRRQTSYFPSPLVPKDMLSPISNEIKMCLQEDKTINLRPTQEIIEISDDEDCFHKKISPEVRDMDQMIDFLIHRCSLKPNSHQTLLKDQQMRIELNGFLLFVNISIRLSLKVSLDMEDRKIFDCIFISSVVIGLDCSVCMNADGINIDKLSKEHLQIALARISSLQVPVRDVNNVGNSNSIHLNPEINKLVKLAMFYVHTYHTSGRLVPTAEVPT